MTEIYHGGGLDAAISQYGGTRSQWLDLSTGINPRPYPVANIEKEVWERLPDAKAEAELLDAAKAYYSVPEGFEIVAAPGTQAIIQLLPEMIGSRRVHIVSPTYGEHAHVWRIAGSDVRFVQDLAEAENKDGAAVVVNPNNPDCREWSARDIIALANKCTFVIADEAFCDAASDSSVVPSMQENVIVLKSFGKFFGLAGLRLGFLIARSELAGELRRRLGPWAVSGPALAIGATALRDQVWIDETKARLKSDSSELAEMLSGAGIKIRGVNPLFVYGHHDFAMELYQYLAEQRILIRPFPDDPKFLRFGLFRCGDEFKRLTTAINNFLNA